jgi:hypothetical protein
MSRHLQSRYQRQNGNYFEHQYPFCSKKFFHRILIVKPNRQTRSVYHIPEPESIAARPPPFAHPFQAENHLSLISATGNHYIPHPPVSIHFPCSCLKKAFRKIHRQSSGGKTYYSQYD